MFCTCILHGVTAVELLQKVVQKELEKVQIKGEELLKQMQEKERGIIQEWLEQLENHASIELVIRELLYVHDLQNVRISHSKIPIWRYD